jgi:hypothetical protein
MKDAIDRVVRDIHATTGLRINWCRLAGRKTKEKNER